MQLFFQPRFTAVDSSHVRMLIKGDINQLWGETPTDLRMGVRPDPVTKFVGLGVTLTETPRKAAINATYQPEQDARKLEEWLEIKPRIFSS
jgi:hypothetical protein